MQALTFGVVEAIVSQQHDIVELLGRHQVQLGAVRQIRRFVDLDSTVLDPDFRRVHGS
jgi:hypothetical protein